MAAESLGELSWLPVADSASYFSNGEALVGKKFCRLSHPHLSQVVPERSPADLRERPLELAATGGNPSCDVVKLEVFCVLHLHELAYLVVEAGAITNSAWTLSGHVMDTTNRCARITRPSTAMLSTSPKVS